MTEPYMIMETKDGVAIEDELLDDQILDTNIIMKAEGTEVGDHTPDQLNIQGSKEIDSVSDDYLHPIPQHLIPRYVCDQKSSVINDYLELDVYDEIDDSPNKNKLYAGEGQSQRTVPERKGPLPVPGDSPRRPSGRRNVLVIVVSVMTVITVLSVGISLGVYFSSDRQKEPSQEKVGETTSAIQTANPDSLGLVKDECTIYPCFNGGSCRMNQQQPSCVCPDGYSGDYCEKILYCVNHPCLHGGSCVEDSSEARCECLLGYHGIHCELDVALVERDITSEIATCKTSSKYYHNDIGTCVNAYDGNIHSDWLSAGEGTGAWYWLYLQQPWVITQLHLRQRCSVSEQTDRMTLQLAGSSQEIQLKCNSYDCEFGFQEFRLNNSEQSNFIHITFTHVCSTNNNGLAELKIWGY